MAAVRTYLSFPRKLIKLVCDWSRASHHSPIPYFAWPIFIAYIYFVSRTRCASACVSQCTAADKLNDCVRLICAHYSVIFAIEYIVSIEWCQRYGCVVKVRTGIENARRYCYCVRDGEFSFSMLQCIGAFISFFSLFFLLLFHRLSMPAVGGASH